MDSRTSEKMNFGQQSIKNTAFKKKHTHSACYHCRQHMRRGCKEAAEHTLAAIKIFNHKLKTRVRYLTKNKHKYCTVNAQYVGSYDILGCNLRGDN